MIVELLTFIFKHLQIHSTNLPLFVSICKKLLILFMYIRVSYVCLTHKALLVSCLITL